jgi:hypothetical protein
MGGGAYSTNNRVNAAVAAKANARAPKTVASVIKDQFVPYSPDWKKDFTDPTGTERKAGETVDRFNVAGDKVGFTMYLDKPVYDSYGNITSNGVRPKHVPYSEDRVVKKNEADPDFNVADYYETTKARADKAITPEETRKVLTSHDPYRGELMRTTPRGYLLDQQVGDPFIETIRSKQIPLTKKLDTPFELDYDYGYDAENLYMKQPPVLGNTDLQQGFTDKEREEYRDLMKRGSFVDISGGTSRVGEYTMAWVEDPPEPSKWEKFLGNPVLSVMGMLNPTIALATTATKAASGMKLSPMEIASSLLTGLEMAGVVKPPTPVDAPVDTPVGNTPSQLPQGTKPPVLGDIAVGGKPPQMTKGTGLFGSSYAETKTALNVAAAGDVKGAALALVNDNLIKDGLDGIGLDQEAIEGAGIQYDDFQAGVGRVVSEVASGTKLDDALVQGLGKYIREGGTLGSIDLPSVDLGIDVDGLSEFIGPIADKLSEVETAVRQGLSEFDKEVLQPSTKPIGDTLSAAETEVRQGLSTLDKEVLQPITQPIGDIVEDVGQAVGDVASDLDTAVRQALPNTSIDLPSVDLPNLDLPNLRLNPSLGSTGMLELKYPSATRTTDALFNDELFKFKNKIEPTKERLEYIDLNEPVENFFEDTINERLPRSYMF